MGNFRIKGLIKFGQKEHLEALLNDGVIYMNNIDYFRKYEESQPKHLRGDKYECFDYISQNNKAIIFDEPSIELNNVTIFENRKTYPGYLYCMYAIRTDSNLHIDTKMLDFGEYTVIIFNPKEFINRINSYCEEHKLYPNCFPVKYYDDKVENGLLHPFLKRSEYSYQNEARIYIHNYNPQDNIVLKLGSIKDIACLMRCKNIR